MPVPHEARHESFGVALAAGTPMRIAMLAPPWIPIPAPGYGGIEEVIRHLCGGFVARGHHVTLFAPPGTRSPADIVELLERPYPDDIQKSPIEADHVAQAFARIDLAAAQAGRSTSSTTTAARSR